MNDNSNKSAQQAVPPPSETTGSSAELADEGLLEQLRADLEAAKDRVLRSQAELENYRKRAAREIDENRRYAELPLMRDLLPVMDNVERAVAAAEQTQDVAVLLDGIKLVARQFEEVFDRHHCKRIGALHLPFDPHLHHAIAQQPSSEFPPNTVLIVAQPGFQLHDRVVRPSQVVVSRLPDDAGAAS